ncbi:MAG: hypothetical protein ACR2IF_08935 [Terriglobales bacterium]
MDDGIQKALRIGEANAEVIKLAQNWCANLQVEKSGGTGLVEIETGLPIGMRSFKCAHASAAGFAGMDLRHIALDFYDRNCNGCQKRVPVMLPNLSQLLGEREKAAAADLRKREAHAERERAAYEQRRAKRDFLSQPCDESTVALFRAIDSLDREPTPQKAEVLAQLASVTPERFQGAVQEALFALVNETSSSSVANGVLAALRQIKADADAMCATALRVLSQAALPIAGSIVAENITAGHVSAVESALPSLIRLAVPFEDFFRRVDPEKHPEGLLAVFRIAPTIVSNVLERLLGDADKLPRIQAVRAIQVLRQADPKYGIELIPALVRSTALPDNHYDVGSAEGWVQDFLADLLENHFDEVDPALTESFVRLQDGDPDIGLDKVYLRLYRSHRHEGKRSRRSSRAHDIIFGRLLNYLATDCAEQGSLQLLDFLRHDAEAYVDLVERHIDGLLGAIAVIAEQRTKTITSSLQLHLPPDPLAALEVSRRKDALYYLIDAIAQLVGKTAKERPETIGRALLSTLAQVDEAHDELRAGLVTALGQMAQNRETLPRVLPHLYAAMTGRSQLVRAAAARGYGEVIADSADDFPPLLHETFITLLSDPYVIVHSAALNVLDRARLPDEYNDRLRLMVLNVIGAHSGTEGRKHVLKVAIDVFLDFHSGKNTPLPASLRDVLIDRILQCDGYDAASMLRQHASKLMDRPNFTKAVLAILKDEDASEYKVEDLMRVLKRVPEAQLRAQADEFVAVMQRCSENDHHVVDAAVEILTGARLWQHAMRLAEREEKRWDDSEWNRPRKLMCQLRTLACAVEFYSSEGNLEKLKECLAAIRRVEEERLKDEAKHRERRDPQFGLAD